MYNAIPDLLRNIMEIWWYIFKILKGFSSLLRMSRSISFMTKIMVGEQTSFGSSRHFQTKASLSLPDLSI